MIELNIGIIGDFNPQNPSHKATNNALQYAAAHLGLKIIITWLPTPSLTEQKELWGLDRFDGLWAAPGSPYESTEGAILAIKQARLFDKPFIGT